MTDEVKQEDELVIPVDLLDKDPLELAESEEDIQTIVYSVGKENGYSSNLREWFKLIYEVLFGEKDGPRMGFFISFFGIQETISLIDDKIK